MGNEEPVLGCMEVTHKGFGVGLGPEIILEIFHALGFCTNIQLVKGIIASGVGSVEIGPGTRGDWGAFWSSEVEITGLGSMAKFSA